VEELRDGKWHPISPSFEYEDQAEERKEELLKKEEYRDKTFAVRQAFYPVDPRKPPRRNR
jgi:hypothetical protein